MSPQASCILVFLVRDKISSLTEVCSRQVLKKMPIFSGLGNPNFRCIGSQILFYMCHDLVKGMPMFLGGLREFCYTGPISQDLCNSRFHLKLNTSTISVSPLPLTRFCTASD